MPLHLVDNLNLNQLSSCVSDDVSFMSGFYFIIMSDDYYANCWKQFHFKIQWSEQKDNIYFSFLHLKKKYQNFLIPKLRNKILNTDTRIVAWIAYIHEFVLFFFGTFPTQMMTFWRKKMFLHLILTFPYQNKF